jgi:hypothetical protein
MCSGLGECGLPSTIWRPWHPQPTAKGLRVTPTLAVARQGGLRQDLVGVFFRADRSSQAFFEASVTVQVGDGSRALFWSDRWLNGCSILQLAPDLGMRSHLELESLVLCGMRFPVVVGFGT